MAEPRAALLELGALLGLSNEGRQQLELAFDRPEELIARFAEQFENRSIAAPIPDLPWLRLVDALRDEKRCTEIDWKASGDDIEFSLKQIIKIERSLQRVLKRSHDEEETDEMLGRLGDYFAREGRALCSIGYGGDNYALVLLPPASVAQAQALANAAGFGSITEWRGPERELRRGPDGRDAPRLREVAAWDDHTFTRLVALPGGRAVALDANQAQILIPGGGGGAGAAPAMLRESLDDLLPSAGRRAAHGQLALFRCGVGFGALSNQRVRVWPTGQPGDAVTLNIEGELPPDPFGRRPAPAVGGTSDRADQVIAIFHGASRLDSVPYLARLRLDLGSRRAAWLNLAGDGQLPQIRRDSFPLPEVARLTPHLHPSPQLQSALLAGEELFACASAPGDPDHPHLARVAADGAAQALLSIDEPARAQFTSCRQYLLVSFETPRRTPRQGFWSLRDRAWVAPVNLVDNMGDRAILDHDAGVWWLRQGRRTIACVADAPG